MSQSRASMSSRAYLGLAGLSSRDSAIVQVQMRAMEKAGPREY